MKGEDSTRVSALITLTLNCDRFVTVERYIGNRREQSVSLFSVVISEVESWF